MRRAWPRRVLDLAAVSDRAGRSGRALVVLPEVGPPRWRLPAGEATGAAFAAMSGGRRELFRHPLGAVPTPVALEVAIRSACRWVL